MNVDSSYLISNLKDFGIVNIQYPENLRKTVQKAVDSWKNFCLLSEEEKMKFTFLEDSCWDGTGYEIKKTKGADLKENFHVNILHYERLKKVTENSFSFLDDAKSLLDQIEPLITEIAEKLEQEYHLKGFKDEVLLSKPNWILRYLHYFGDQEEGNELAAPHADKGGLTLHLYESDKGLEHYCLQTSKWKPMPVHEKETVIIPGLQLQFRSKGILKGLYHRVVATKKTAKEGRFSMVCFITFEKTSKYNKGAFGNVQSHTTGFNYQMSHKKFEHFFL